MVLQAYVYVFKSAGNCDVAASMEIGSEARIWLSLKSHDPFI